MASRQHFLVCVRGPTPARSRGAPPPRAASARFARAGGYVAPSRLDQLLSAFASVLAAWNSFLSHQLLIQAAVAANQRRRAKRGAGSAWGWGPTRRRGGGAPRRNQVMLIQAPESPHWPIRPTAPAATTRNVCAGPIGVDLIPAKSSECGAIGAWGDERALWRAAAAEPACAPPPPPPPRPPPRPSPGFAGRSARRFHATRFRPAVLSTSSRRTCRPVSSAMVSDELVIARQRLLHVIGEHGAERWIGRGPQS